MSDRDDLWASFLNTRIRIFSDRGITEIEIGAAMPPTAGASDDLVQLVTAWNPFGVQLEASENEARQRAFEAQLDGSGYQWLPAAGVAEDGTWSEAGAAIVGISRQEGIEIARKWDQEAIYEWNPDRSLVAVVSCVDDRVWTRAAVAHQLGPDA